MPALKKLKTTLKLGKEKNIDFQPAQDILAQPLSPLKRVNAKLRKDNKSAVNLNSGLADHYGNNATHAGEDVAAVDGSQQEQTGHRNSRQYSWEAGGFENLPLFAMPFRPPPRKQINSAAQPVQDLDQAESSSSFLSKLKKKKLGKTAVKPDRDQPVDNFTKWDVPRNIANVQPSPSVVHLAQNNPYRDASEVRRSWANSSQYSDDDDDGGASFHDAVKNIPIGDIDWSQYEDNDRLRELLAMYNEEQKQLSPTSPADSGVCLDSEPSGKGKGKVRAVDTDAQAEEAHDLNGSVDRVLALELALRLEMEAQQRVWADRTKALEIEKEEELDRIRQEEEDRLRAKVLVEEEERQAAIRARLRECVCCGDEKDTLEYPAKSATISCDHPSQTCNDCMHSWLDSEFDTKGAEGIKCPECPQALSYTEIQNSSSPETFAKYEKLLTRNALGDLDEFSWCLSPTCNSGQLNAENNHFMECAACLYKQCLNCKIAWHVGETCAQYEYRISGQKDKDDRAKEEEATAKMIDTVSKTCPGKKCGWRIQKTHGCDHMTCRKCKFEFCWECKASHKEILKVGNDAHLESCKFHSKNLGTQEMAWPFAAHR